MGLGVAHAQHRQFWVSAGTSCSFEQLCRSTWKYSDHCSDWYDSITAAEVFDMLTSGLCLLLHSWCASNQWSLLFDLWQTDLASRAIVLKLYCFVQDLFFDWKSPCSGCASVDYWLGNPALNKSCCHESTALVVQPSLPILDVDSLLLDMCNHSHCLHNPQTTLLQIVNVAPFPNTKGHVHKIIDFW